MMESEESRPADWRTTLPAQTRVLQIIVGSLIAGVVGFTAFVIFSGSLQKPPQGQFLSYAAVAFGAAMAVMHVVIPGLVERAALANQPVGLNATGIVGVFVTRTIIAAALLEGAAMMSIVALMIEHQPWVLGVTAVLLVLMALQIPTVTRIEHWLEAREMERSSSAS